MIPIKDEKQIVIKMDRCIDRNRFKVTEMIILRLINI